MNLPLLVLMLAASPQEGATPPANVVLVSNENGHAYAVRHGSRSWEQADSLARAAGGELVSITTEAEAAIVSTLATGDPALWTVDDARANGLGPWIGAVPSSAEERRVLHGVGRLMGDDWCVVPASHESRGCVIEWEDARAVAPVLVNRELLLRPPLEDLVPESCPGPLAEIGDLDGDGRSELALGVFGRPGRNLHGEVRILWMNDDGTIRRTRRLAADGREIPALPAGSEFGHGLAGLGDLDQDGVPDLAVSVRKRQVRGIARGEVLLLFLRSDGTVREVRSIRADGSTPGVPLPADRPAPDWFGEKISACDDFDGDGIPDLAVGAGQVFWGGTARGAVWIFLLRRDGTVRESLRINSLDGDFRGKLEDHDRFSTVCWLPDLDGDGVPELAVGAFWDDDVRTNSGAVWTLFLRTDGTVHRFHKIAAGTGEFGVVSRPHSIFGSRVFLLDDLDGDGRREVAVGATGADNRTGALWILFLRSDGSVREATCLGGGVGGLTHPPQPGDVFGAGVLNVEIDGQPPRELVVSSLFDDEFCKECGSLRVLFLDLPARGNR